MKDFTERFKQLTEGKSDEEIARQLDVSTTNVRRYREGMVPPAAKLFIEFLEEDAMEG